MDQASVDMDKDQTTGTEDSKWRLNKNESKLDKFSIDLHYVSAE